MEAKAIILLLSSANLMYQNRALKTIDRNMKRNILSGVSTPVYVDKDALWSLALEALWKHVSVKQKEFDYSQPNSIQRFLSTVCWKQMLKQVESRNKKKQEFLEIAYWSQVAADTDIESTLIEMEVVQKIQALFAVCLGSTEQQVLINRFYLQMNYKEMSLSMNMPATSLRVIKYRAINRLKKQMHQDAVLKAQLKFLLGKSDRIN